MIASFRLSSNFFLVASTSSLIKPGEEDFSPDRIRMKTSRPEWSPIFQRDFAAAKLTSGDGSLRAFFSRGMERRARICPRFMAASWRMEESLSSRAFSTRWRTRGLGAIVPTAAIASARRMELWSVAPEVRICQGCGRSGGVCWSRTSDSGEVAGSASEGATAGVFPGAEVCGYDGRTNSSNPRKAWAQICEEYLSQAGRHLCAARAEQWLACFWMTTGEADFISTLSRAYGKLGSFETGPRPMVCVFPQVVPGGQTGLLDHPVAVPLLILGASSEAGSLSFGGVILGRRLLAVRRASSCMARMAIHWTSLRREGLAIMSKAPRAIASL